MGISWLGWVNCKRFAMSADPLGDWWLGGLSGSPRDTPEVARGILQLSFLPTILDDSGTKIHSATSRIDLAWFQG